MADLLSIGVSGLLAYRRALDTTSNNIANANTPGYTRQRAELVSTPGIGAGFGFIGTGVEVATIRRLTDGIVNTRLQSDASSYSRLEVFSGFASRVDSLLSDPAAGLSQPLKGLYDAANTVAQNPTSLAARQAFIGTSETLATRMRETQSQLDQMDGEVDTRLRMTVEEINNLTQSIADLNGEIAFNYGQFSGQPPNDLLDRRDQLLQELSSRVGVFTVAQEDGSINVFTGSGQSLVIGQQSTDLGVAPDAYNSGRLDIVYGTSSAPITAQLSGGALGGLIDVRREVIDPARAELGRLAVGIAESFNAQHAEGMDLYGDLGGDFFVPPQGVALAATANGGSASVSVGYGDFSQLGDGDYELRYDGASWSLRDLRTGSAVALTGTGAPGDPLVGDGLELTISGSASAGDRFLVRPTALAAGDIQVSISDPSRVAAASPLRAAANVANSGSATASTPTIDDAANVDLLDAVDITFTGPNTYQINGSGSFTFTPGTPISVNGWSLNLTGTPAAGDSFTVSAAGANNGDNTNAQALAGLSSQSIFGGGRGSALQAHAGLVASAGLRAQQAGMRLDAQAAISAQTIAERESQSGVNLDEEAADLIRLQQAYQAAARVVQVADTIFQTLIRAAGG
ncbi:MAG: flagellar hook-associated protein FlgK [Sinimarinibacterium sp.]|jgi:flagellar hook-associated protein 1 FlgK